MLPPSVETLRMPLRSRRRVSGALEEASVLLLKRSSRSLVGSQVSAVAWVGSVLVKAAASIEDVLQVPGPLREDVLQVRAL